MRPTSLLTNLIVGLGICITLLWTSGCRPFGEEVITNIDINLQDTVYRQIIDWQDKGLSDSLYPYFDHRDPTYRYAAAIAFGSIQDSTAIDSLQPLLADPVDRVRAGAAYALGQIGDPSAAAYLTRAFNRYDTIGQWTEANRHILEAVGKCGDAEALRQISQVKHYRQKDTSLLEGQIHSIYRFALRGITDPSGTECAVQLLEAPHADRIKLMAAHYLHRAQSIDLTNYVDRLIPLFRGTQSPDLRMPLATALGKTQDSLAYSTLEVQYQQETDYRVRCNIIRALRFFPYAQVQGLVINALQDSDPHVRQTAADFLLDHGQPQDATFYWRLARDTFPPNIQTQLYAAANRHLPTYFADFRNEINFALQQRYKNSGDAQVQIATLNALAEFPWNYRIIQQLTASTESPLLKSTAMAALQKISDREDFAAFFGLSRRRVRYELAQAFQQGITTGDVGVIYHAAQALARKKSNYIEVIDSTQILEAALAKLSLPRDTEAYYELDRAINQLKGTPSKEVNAPPTWNHPIPWSILTRFETRPVARIQTDKGIVKLELLPELAPGSCANFIELVEQGFYDNKTWHRVVPNFVIQGGCPRGDGFGALDYSIRSELPPSYYNEAGYVGMASAGLHTEGTQFFITHSATPHLDGRYTIFARVTEGMDVVHQVLPGDAIKKITIR